MWASTRGTASAAIVSMATPGDRAYGVQPNQADWHTTGQHIGIHHTDPQRARDVQVQRIAGLDSAAAGYHAAANDFPRFERQKVRAIFDEGILNGTKRPHPEMLRRFPNREKHDSDMPTYPLSSAEFDKSNDRARMHAMRRPGSGRSGRSGRSCRSDRSSASIRSAARSISGSSNASSLPPSGYYRQAPEKGTQGCTEMYKRSSQWYGSGGFVGKEPCPGREAWMLGRGGGQISSYDNCLVQKGRQIPLIVDK